MQPLQGKYGTIESSVKLLLSDYRRKHNCQVGDPEADAMTLLLHYDWPQNYNQLIRVVSKIATFAGNGVIAKEIVSEALTTEMLSTQGITELCANTFLDLTKPLSEINADIIRILLEQNDGNQSQTAKSLGISRTTMWRMLKEQNDQKRSNNFINRSRQKVDVILDGDICFACTGFSSQIPLCPDGTVVLCPHRSICTKSGTVFLPLGVQLELAIYVFLFGR